MVRRSPLLLLCLLGLQLWLYGCPANNSTPCSSNADCSAEQVCRRGACGPICVSDTDCGVDQVCRSGTCVAKPQCTADTDCATGFACVADRCQCTQDSSCAANQVCTNGTCTQVKRCTADADCLGSGKRCEVSQGLCLPVCQMAADCAPGLDPNVAFALYTCVQGTCARRCVADVTCGGAGLICRAGLCTTAECATTSQCPAGQYCTSATFGRCLAAEPCESSSECSANFTCATFDPTQCPPGFDCTKKLCQELPSCFIDADCVAPASGPGGGQLQTGYCSSNHCQPALRCPASNCGAGTECVAGLCVPATCRGIADCPNGQACTDGACLPPPPAVQTSRLKLTPKLVRLEVGEATQLSLMGYRLSGTTYPVSEASYEVSSDAGLPLSVATVTDGGTLTAVGPGQVMVTASIAGSNVVSNAISVEVVPPPTQGRRVMVVDLPSGSPLANVTVRGCEVANCTSPSDITTGPDGIAQFSSLGAGPASFTAVSAEVRAEDGLPRYERASVLFTSAADVYLPLDVNPVQQAGGFTASISFSDVHTVGAYWAGFAVASVSDLPSWGLPTLLGETFNVDLAGSGQRVPVPGPLVLYSSPGFGIPQEVKGKAFALAQPGTPRHLIAFAGRTNIEQVSSLRSTAILSYLGAFDFTVALDFTVPALPRVSDTTDIDADGLCASPTRCPMGTESVPDYAAFASLNFKPNRAQQRRTEVVVPNLPATLSQAIVAAVEVGEAGALPTGFAAPTVGTLAPDGTRRVEPVVLRSAAAGGSLEAAQPGVWVLGISADGVSTSARLSLGATLPTRVLVAPLLPVPSGGTYTPATRTYSPGQPAWAAAYSGGARLARLRLTGTQGRHTLYWAHEPQQTAVEIPPSPVGPGIDPATQASATFEVATMELPMSPDEVFTLRGVDLSSLPVVITAYSRWEK